MTTPTDSSIVPDDEGLACLLRVLADAPDPRPMSAAMKRAADRILVLTNTLAETEAMLETSNTATREMHRRLGVATDALADERKKVGEVERHLKLAVSAMLRAGPTVNLAGTPEMIAQYDAALSEIGRCSCLMHGETKPDKDCQDCDGTGLASLSKPPSDGE